MKQTDKQERIDHLFQIITSIDDPEDCRALFEDLFTAKEIYRRTIEKLANLD